MASAISMYSTDNFRSLNIMVSDMNRALSGNQLNKFYSEISKLLLKDIRRNFGDESANDMQNNKVKKWQKLKPATIKRRIALGYNAGPILMMSGNLLSSIKIIDSNKAATIGTDVIYANAQNYGRTDINLPARSFYNISRDEFKEIEKLIIKRVQMYNRTGK